MYICARNSLYATDSRLLGVSPTFLLKQWNPNLTALWWLSHQCICYETMQFCRFLQWLRIDCWPFSTVLSKLLFFILFFSGSTYVSHRGAGIGLGTFLPLLGLLSKISVNWHVCCIESASFWVFHGFMKSAEGIFDSTEVCFDLLHIFVKNLMVSACVCP